MADFDIKQYVSSVHNRIDPENIPVDASQDAYNWITKDGVIELIRGKSPVHSEGLIGSIQGEGFGYRTDGTKIHYRKTTTAIQYDNGTTWVDIVTGLTDGYKVFFVNYQSLAGAFTFAFSLDGIYKMHNSFPVSYISLYDATKNFKFAGAIIDKGRTLAWGQPKDRTGLYGSYIDAQRVGDQYTAVASEVLGSGNGVAVTFTGTLAFKGGGATRNAFGLTVTDGTETFTDNYDGTLTGSLGGTGTINYMTGAFSVTFDTAPANTPNNILGSYTWEDSNAEGVTDFSKSATRLAGEGFILRQDEGGDAILKVEVGLDGSYYSLKQRSAYQLTLDVTDLAPTNLVFRREIGILSARGSVSTQKGIMFMNTANLERTECTILQQNPLGGNVEPFILFPHFKFENYTYDEAVMGTYGQYVIVSCKTIGADNNDTTLLLDLAQNTVSITGYGASTFATDETFLYMGSPLTMTVYKVYNGFDDEGTLIENFWIGKGETFKVSNLKKIKKLRIKGRIEKSQSFQIYIDYDDSGFQLVGTVLGTASYVDLSSSQTIGSNMVGEAMVGGDNTTLVYPFFTEIRIKTPKFRKRTIKYVALGYGYVNIDTTIDRDILLFENKLPSKYRQKNYVSLDGTTTGNSLPEY